MVRKPKDFQYRHAASRVAENLGSFLKGHMPVGSLVADWADDRSLPNGFETCDGKEVTLFDSPITHRLKPNLVDRFPRGVEPGKLKSDQQGGKTEVQLVPGFPRR